MASRGTLRIGTAGWSYKHWVGPFYPEGTPAREYLSHYAARFRATELNTTFYSLPKPESLRAWAAAAPKDFVFACKASRYITHMKKLKDPETSTRKFFDAIDVLGERCGPVLVQLPPNWGVDTVRLRSFLEALPQRHRFAFEFRDESWFDDTVYALLADHGAGLVIYDLERWTSPLRATADLVYIRLHGPGETAYTGSYDAATLQSWADRICGWREEGRDVYCFFDNDEAGHAPRNALTLQEMVGS